MTDEDAILRDALSQITGPREGKALDGSDASSREFPLHAVPSPGRCRRVLYTTKVEWLTAITDGLARVPDDVALLWRYGPLGAAHRALLDGILQTLDAPLCFIGDLDPLDLVTYATLREHNAPPARHLGISDAWLDLCERGFARAGMTLKSVCIPMDPSETAAVETLAGLSRRGVISLGPRALSILQSGLKLELEGASNPRLYSTAFLGELTAFLFG